jgi:hypothetical protein
MEIKENVRIKTVVNKNPGALFRFCPQVEVAKWAFWVFKFGKSWAYFYNDQGKRIEFNSVRKAERWIKRQFVVEYRDFKGTIKIS